MERLPSTDLLLFKPDNLNVVRKAYDLHKPGAMDQAIDIMEEWLKKQNHFTKKEFPRGYLERMIICSKGSVERAKERLDRLFTIRTMMPLFFKDYDARTDFQNIQDAITYVILPKMTEDYDRVYLCQLAENIKLSSNLFLEGYKFCFLLSEYARAHDYCNSYHIVIDYSHVNVGEMLAKVNIQELHQCITAQVEGYGVRIKSIHIITPSKLIDAVLAIAKQILSAKIAQRVHSHKTYDTLFEHLPRHIFPKDYGGDDRTLAAIHADWRKEFCTEEYREYWKSMNAARTDESLRQKDVFNNQYMGMPGTFKTLSVD